MLISSFMTKEAWDGKSHVAICLLDSWSYDDCCLQGPAGSIFIQTLIAGSDPLVSLFEISFFICLGIWGGGCFFVCFGFGFFFCFLYFLFVCVLGFFVVVLVSCFLLLFFVWFLFVWFWFCLFFFFLGCFFFLRKYQTTRAALFENTLWKKESYYWWSMWLHEIMNAILHHYLLLYDYQYHFIRKSLQMS